MRWLTFAGVMFVVLILQTSIARAFSIGEITPDWLIVLVTLAGLYSRRKDAIIAGCVVGVCADLLSMERLGVMTLCLTVAALVGNSVRHLVFLKNALTHFVVTLIAALAVQMVLAIQHALMYHGPAGSDLVYHTLATAVWSAAWAPPMAAVLLRMNSLLGLHTSRYTHSRFASVVR